MAARPPQNDDSSPDAIEFGIAALDARLDGDAVEFPATADELVRALDDPTVPYDASGNGIALSEALESIPQNRFGSKTELLDVLHPVFEERRSSGPSGVIGRLRGLLPF
jgi:hypothetical protein